MFIDKITFAGGDRILLCLRTYLELPSVNLHCRAYICFMRFYLIKSRENKKY
jgi:hypothetical protein